MIFTENYDFVYRASYTYEVYIRFLLCGRAFVGFPSRAIRFGRGGTAVFLRSPLRKLARSAAKSDKK